MSVYETYFLQERRICPNCFVHIRDVEPKPHRDVLRYRLSGRTLVEIMVATTRPAGEGELTWTPPKSGQYGVVQAASHPQTVCERCGVIDMDPEPRPIAELIEDGESICEWLEDRGVAIDRDQFFDTLRTLKKDPDAQNRDVEIISVSLEAAVDRSPCVSTDDTT